MQVSGAPAALTSWSASLRRKPTANACGAVNAVGPPSLPVRPRPVDAVDAMRDFRDKLRSLGQLDNTLVLYTGDHGLLWADHGWLRKSVPYRPSLEVPFYLSWPGGGLGTARTDDRLTAHVDIAPTLLDAAGITPDTPHDSHWLLGTRDRDHVLTEWWWNRQDKQPIASA
ncbi:sulfatase-like hydrolase/transferase [Streptomyces mirabilis]|uniref:sulfatase-like hydrolase/transferase n=1 Tax=Streptomyces mirabilis TaxID=68239 RepID=UPI00201DAAFB|nr:sulfatase-like hydrolase/transferase [Streptomyces mirabilis]